MSLSFCAIYCTLSAYEIEDDEPEEDVPIDLDVVMY